MLARCRSILKVRKKDNIVLDIFQINLEIFVENTTSFSICKFGEKDDILSRESLCLHAIIWTEQTAINE